MIGTLDILNLIGMAATSILLAYAAYWSFNVRGVLVVHAYRRQALGTALIALFLSFSGLVDTLGSYVYTGNAFGVITGSTFGLYVVFLLIYFYWVDASVIAVRRSDPKGRDTFHWSKLRLVLWAFTILGAVVYVTVIIVDLITLGPAAAYSTPLPSLAGIYLVLYFSVYIAQLLPLVSAAVMLPIVARRTADLTFRAELKWFGAFTLVFLVVADLLGSYIALPSTWYNIFLWYLGLAVGSYCLDRSVSSLTPISPYSVTATETDRTSGMIREVA